MMKKWLGILLVCGVLSALAVTVKCTEDGEQKEFQESERNGCRLCLLPASLIHLIRSALYILNPDRHVMTVHISLSPEDPDYTSPEKSRTQNAYIRIQSVRFGEADE